MSNHSHISLLKPVNDYKRTAKQPDLFLMIPAAERADENEKTREREIPPEEEPDGEDVPEVDPLDDEPFPEDPLGNDLPEFDPPEEEPSELSRRSPK